MSDTPSKPESIVVGVLEKPLEMPKLTVKQQQFVAAVTSGMSARDAVPAAGYHPKSVNIAEQMGTNLLRHPKIQQAITVVIKEKFPDVEADAARLLVNTMNDPEETTGMRLKALELLSKFFGWQAPTKHASINLEGQFKLPGEE